MVEKQKNSVVNNKRGQISRRRFITGGGAAALSLVIVKPGLVRGTEANSKIKLGMIGCGGRGTWIADLFGKHGGYQIVAVADYFQDRVDAFGEKFKLDSVHRYSGLSCYRRLLEQKVDAVAIESPPYFHPEQAAAAVDAGCHAYVAKPIAVDVPGCQIIAESGTKATANKLCLLVDFQTRANAYYREAVKRAQYGDIGRIVCGEACYQTGSTWGHMDKVIQADPDNPEVRLKAWGRLQELSGDIITEQNIHALDVACWVLDADPVSAYGTGGRKARKGGDCWDHFAVIYHYPNDVVVSFSSKQFGRGYSTILCRMYGTEGTIHTDYKNHVNIRGNTPYAGGETKNIYTDGVVKNIADFYDNITNGRFANTTVASSVRSNLTTILGRTAAYEHREVRWDEMMKNNKKMEANLKGLKA